MPMLVPRAIQTGIKISLCPYPLKYPQVICVNPALLSRSFFIDRALLLHIWRTVPIFPTIFALFYIHEFILSQRKRKSSKKGWTIKSSPTLAHNFGRFSQSDYYLGNVTVAFWPEGPEMLNVSFFSHPRTQTTANNNTNKIPVFIFPPPCFHIITENKLRNYLITRTFRVELPLEGLPDLPENKNAHLILSDGQIWLPLEDSNLGPGGYK